MFSYYKKRDVWSAGQNVFEFRQQLVGCDDAGHFGVVDAVNDGRLTEGGVQRDQRHALLHASVGSQKPLGSSLGKNHDVVPGLHAELSQTSAEVVRFLIHLGVGAPFVVSHHKLEMKNNHPDIINFAKKDRIFQVFERQYLFEYPAVRLDLVFFRNDLPRSESDFAVAVFLDGESKHFLQSVDLVLDEIAVDGTHFRHTSILDAIGALSQRKRLKEAIREY